MRRSGTAVAALGLLLGAMLCLSRPAAAVDDLPPMPTPALQHRYLALTHELRCMQCQDETIADSPVSLAADMRQQVQTMLLAGRTNQQIRQHFVSLYGEFVLFRPPMVWRNAWLWGSPLVLLIIGVFVASRVLRSHRQLLETDRQQIEEP